MNWSNLIWKLKRIYSEIVIVPYESACSSFIFFPLLYYYTLLYVNWNNSVNTMWIAESQLSCQSDTAEDEVGNKKEAITTKKKLVEWRTDGMGLMVLLAGDGSGSKIPSYICIYSKWIILLDAFAYVCLWEALYSACGCAKMHEIARRAASKLAQGSYPKHAFAARSFGWAFRWSSFLLAGWNL